LLGCNKVLKVLKVDREELIYLFRREAQVLSWLEHPGIPAVEPDGYFIFPSKDKPMLHCLVMEKIEGESLELWIKYSQNLSSFLVLKWLKDLTKILEQIHKNDLFHRDIKPSNIIRKPNGQITLIDFGAVKQTLQVLYGQEGVTVLTPGYAAPEQFERQAVPQSDFYALGRTFVHLLTQQHPIDLAEEKGRLLWRQYLPLDFPVLLADFIDELMAPSICDRPDSTAVVLQRVKEIFNILLASKDGKPIPTLQEESIKIPSSKITKVTIGIVSGICISTLVGGVILQQHFHSSQRIMISTGETSFLPKKVSVEKQSGMDALSRKDYNAALRYFKISIDDFHDSTDPEARIFLNNARIGPQKSYTIAVSIPLECPFNRVEKTRLANDSYIDSTLKILSGIENVQEEANRQKGINGIPLKIAIACGESQDSVKPTAQEIVNHPEILGVIGPPSPRATQAAEKIYCKKLVVLSPVSSSEELKNCDRHVFRLIPRDSDTAKVLSQHLSTKFQRRKAVIFFNSANFHSRSLKKEFGHTFSSNGGKILAEIDLRKPRFNAKESMKYALSLKADALILFSDNRVLDKALQVIKANHHQLLMLGGSNIFSLKTLAVGSENALGMIVATPCNAGIESVQEWKSYLTKDALYTFIAALKQRPTRLGIRKTLMASNFQTAGACGKVRFSSDGDRKSPVSLAKILPGQHSGTGYDFVPLP
jgi:eukaryotic-like serine/threonine-protein kinase